jgi:hypothetical protein
MNWSNFKTYGESPEKAFETLCNQLFERYLHRTYGSKLQKYRVINGAGGDGGIEAYGEIDNGQIIAIQSKYFRQALEDGQINQIRNSIITAKGLRDGIKVYVICIPHNVSSLKRTKGKIPTKNDEEQKINRLVADIKSLYNDLELIWWFDNEILNELQISNNEGIHKYWFEKESISIDSLKKQFGLQKNGWLKLRYISELHGNGVIHKEYNKICFTKDYRMELNAKLNEDKYLLNRCIHLIEEFITTSDLSFLNKRLLVIKRNIICFLSEIEKICTGIENGYDSVYSANLREVEIWETKYRLEKLKPTNLQKNVLPKLISSLNNVHGFNLPEYVESYCNFFNQKIRLIFGGAGTGKTHGLSNSVENHLNNNMPALIIQAKGNYSNNWTEILSKALELPNWTKQDIFTALESCAIRNDNEKTHTLKSGEELNSESTKILICVDGLEEDISNEAGWINRIEDSVLLIQSYPRLRFLFSARNYFQSNSSISRSTILDTVYLSREGDVQIHEVIDDYLKEYDIELSHYSLIKGIDSLLALRLFCEKYRGTRFFAGDKTLTATSELLNDKVQRANDEFAQLLLPRRLNKARRPFFEALSFIAKYFYSNITIEHNNFCLLLKTEINYLEISELDILIEYLANNGFLIKSERITNNGGALNEVITEYHITYQSIIEHIISFDILNNLKSGKLTKIPDILHSGMIMPLDYAPKKFDFFDVLPNKKIIQDIINAIFNDTGRLVGENGFLTEGFKDEEIFKMQMEAIGQAPTELAFEYKPMIDSLFLGGFRSQFKVLKYLILPSSNNNKKFFGSEYLHDILINLPSAFERDKLWSGLDRYEKFQLSEEDRFSCDYYTLANVFDELGIGSIHLYSEQEYNEQPLFFAWGLSTINQKLRKELRFELTKWAIEQPHEFIKLLNKIFCSNDPQIQEDLASIMLGVATKLKDGKAIKELAVWTIENIFSKIEIYRNIIIRQGFRAIVEKAYLMREISDREVEICRPKPIHKYSLLELDQDYLANPVEEYYPIVHDLAWYVIKKTYNNFLEAPTRYDDELKDNNGTEASLLLSQYNIPGLYSRNFGMAAAISYIKSLGLNRVVGNGTTDATHGEKSEIFTYEEKYTWLAVHYIQGYLSDYVPMELGSGKREFVTDYSQLSEIHNPAESIKDMDEWYEDYETNFSTDWVIKELLVTEIGNDITEGIKYNVNTEIKYDFSKWVRFISKDFNIKDNNEWLALYNKTVLHDSKSLVYSWMLLEGCLIKKDDISNFIQSITNNLDNFNFISEFNSLISYPKDGSNCNPSDLIWMSWIDEENQSQEYYDIKAKKENTLLNSIVEVDYFKMPSRIIRQYLDINELRNKKLLNTKNEIVSFIHKLEDNDTGDSQHMVLVDSHKLKSVMERNNYEVVWFAEVLKQKNPLNKKIRNKYLEQKVRKYFIWNDDGELKDIKIWDARYSNSKD